MNEILSLTKESILKAAAIIDQNPSLRKGRESLEYDLVLNEKKYPPILVLSEANKVLGGQELLLTHFNNSTKKAFKIFEDLNLKVVKKMFTWLPLYAEMAKWVLQYQDKQLKLIDILKKIGFDGNLEDEDNSGKIPLREIDPFTFFAFFQKLRNSNTRTEHLKRLKEIANLKSEMPSDFNGLPSAQPMSVWFFTSKKYRDPNAIAKLWELSRQTIEGRLSADLFINTIQQRGVKIAKLSQGLFWLNPDRYYPIDAHKNFLEDRGINTEIETLPDYLRILEEIKTKFNQPFYEISYNAWKSNQSNSENKIDDLSEKLLNVWIEKTLVEGRPDRETGERALGKALWSPQKGKGGADIYKNMRLVNVGDIVLHLIDNQEISGISRVKNTAIETSGLTGTAWDGPCYLVELDQYTELNPEIDRSEFLIEANKDLLGKIAEESEVFYNNKLDLRQGAYLTPCTLELFEFFNKKYRDLSTKNLPFFDEFDFKEELNEKNQDNLNALPMKYLTHFICIKTKPFIILAGLSGTGKSRLPRIFAYQFNNIDEDKSTRKHPPTNFHLIKVKPNWHDSSELLGYESRISGKDRFIVTDFIRFIIKAWQYQSTPFFLCLDEMNLAPVEQYFAEYLSIIETRRVNENGNIKTDALISSSLFTKYAKKTDGVDENYDLWSELELYDASVQMELQTNGLSLPPNFIVMGTVNMDETTHSFSRKVLDRAMTIEMSDINLLSGLDETANEWKYPKSPLQNKLVFSEKTQGCDVFKDLEDIGSEIINYLNSINEKLEGSPFKIAYRVRDEFLLYAFNYLQLASNKHYLLQDVLDQMTLVKILPRIEGDEDRTKVLDELITLFRKENLPKSLIKADEMANRRNLFHYTSYWS